MAYRRRQGNPRVATFEELRSASGPPRPPAAAAAASSGEAEPPSLAAQAIRASSAHRDSSLSSAYGESAISPAYRESNRQSSSTSPRDPGAFEYTSMKSLNESKYGFWGVLARKAKALVEDDNGAQKFETSDRKQSPVVGTARGGQFQQSYRPPESYRKAEATSQKNSDSLASSLNHIGGTIKNALEEGLTIVENRTADIIQETRRLHIRRKGSGPDAQNQNANKSAHYGFPQIQADYETQLKASRDVANAMAAKAKLLLRELKTVKADLAFAKERCAQLEEENKMLRESQEKGGTPEDDDLIRLQLETLLAEKGRLAHENSVYARENRFLREIVEYHQLTMQDVVYVDEGIEEVTEVFSSSSPIQIPTSNNSNASHAAAAAAAAARSPSPGVPLTPSPTRPPAIIVPEACHVIPVPPTPSPVASTRTGLPPPPSQCQNANQPAA